MTKWYRSAHSKPLDIAASRSGSTTETLIALKLFRKTYNSRVLSLMKYLDAAIVAVSDYVISMSWANEISICQKAEQTIRDLIQAFPRWKSLVTLGSGVQTGVAFEGAYICIEMAQFPSKLLCHP